MSRTWKFTDFEFYALWRDLTHESLPWPLSFTTDVMGADEFERRMREVLDRARLALDPSFAEVLDTIWRPDLRIAINGFDSRAPREPRHLLRVLAVRRRERGYLVTQSPGKEYSYAAGYTVTECEAITLADAAVELMPKADAGKLDAITLARSGGGDDEMAYSYGRSAVLRTTSTDTVQDQAARLKRFMDTAAPSVGTIDIVQGRSIYGPRGITRHQLQWRDLLDDGRYVIEDGDPPVAAAADGQRLIKLINARIAAIVRVIKDEGA
ncbi:ESX secretion-associated protein EspG [Nocardia panacis]|uniref:ESX secretion-associated protein EspG n=1 Tax=Nocardia panacis TaxID=2340916 RepID=A0A3A4K4Z6_9NOCA|nr:ESX secretion-associated protein EspG [Nocardia panacis]RJO72095.1 ESX secretion-associated protein EspG [Nocardia panacis]